MKFILIEFVVIASAVVVRSCEVWNVVDDSSWTLQFYRWLPQGNYTKEPLTEFKCAHQTYSYVDLIPQDPVNVTEINIQVCDVVYKPHNINVTLFNGSRAISVCNEANSTRSNITVQCPAGAFQLIRIGFPATKAMIGQVVIRHEKGECSASSNASDSVVWLVVGPIALILSAIVVAYFFVKKRCNEREPITESKHFKALLPESANSNFYNLQ